LYYFLFFIFYSVIIIIIGSSVPATPCFAPNGHIIVIFSVDDLFPPSRSEVYFIVQIIQQKGVGKRLCVKDQKIPKIILEYQDSLLLASGSSTIV